MCEKESKEDPISRTISECDSAVRAYVHSSRNHLRTTCIHIRDKCVGFALTSHAPCEINGADECHLAGDVCPSSDPARERGVFWRSELRRKVV